MASKDKLAELRKQYKKYIFHDIDAFLIWQYYTNLDIYLPMLSYLEKGYPIYKTSNILCVANKNKIKNFVKNDGYIIFYKDKKINEKIEFCQSNNIKYLITDNIKDIQYNTKEVNYGF